MPQTGSVASEDATPAVAAPDPGGAVTAPDDAVMLEKVVPAIVNYAIALFKDTTLVMIVGLFDLLNIVSAGAADPRWLGSSAEGYVFVALVFWIFLLRVLALQSARRAPIEAGPDVLMGRIWRAIHRP